MVHKAVQQLLFDVDWREHDGGPGLDLLVLDMPPGTGDVPLTLGQLVQVDGELDSLDCMPEYESLQNMRCVAFRCCDCIDTTGRSAS